MEHQGDVFDDYETYLKAHLEAVQVMMNLEHVPRYIRLMELKSIMRKLQSSVMEIDSHARFLDSAHRKDRHDPI